MAAGSYNFAFCASHITFACSKMNMSSRNHSEIVALNEHTSMTVRDIATAVGVGKSSVSRI